MVPVSPAGRAACEAVGALLAELLPQALPVPWPADVMAKRRALLADLDAASAGQIKPQLRKMIGRCDCKISWVASSPAIPDPQRPSSCSLLVMQRLVSPSIMLA
jgi:hypothetical protein